MIDRASRVGEVEGVAKFGEGPCPEEWLAGRRWRKHTNRRRRRYSIQVGRASQQTHRMHVQIAGSYRNAAWEFLRQLQARLLTIGSWQIRVQCSIERRESRHRRLPRCQEGLRRNRRRRPSHDRLAEAAVESGYTGEQYRRIRQIAAVIILDRVEDLPDALRQPIVENTESGPHHSLRVPIVGQPDSWLDIVHITIPNIA